MTKPIIVVSKCFFVNVRYNGGIVKEPFVDSLKNFVKFIEVCPEVSIGLGVPRPSINIVYKNKKMRLIQLTTGIDLTEMMERFTHEFLNGLTEVDGFILKSRSPSCGISSAKFFENKTFKGITDGFFAREVKNRFPFFPIEHEGRLRDMNIREHFLTRIFAFFEFRNLKKKITQAKLVEFYTSYKFLLMTYHQSNFKVLGRIVAEKADIRRKLEKFEPLFYHSFQRIPSRKKNYNTILHIFGYFKDKINPKEKRHFLALTENYLKEKVDFIVIRELLWNFANRFENEYLLKQKYLRPYPAEIYF